MIMGTTEKAGQHGWEVEGKSDTWYRGAASQEESWETGEWWEQQVQRP